MTQGRHRYRERPIPRPPRRRLAENSHLPIAEECSAGGMAVANVDGVPSVAVIARRARTGKMEWCLPKGHIEAGEDAPTAAVREIQEETGIEGKVICPIASIEYWFTSPHNRIHKVVHHFLVEATGGQISVEGDPDHEAEEAAWIPLDKVGRVLAYPNERRIVKAALQMLHLD